MKILKQTLKEEKTLILLTLALSLFLIITVIGMYPGDDQAEEIFKMIESIEIIKVIINVEFGESGLYLFWLAMELFSVVYFIPVFLAAMSGTAIFAHEQDSNRLDILMSMPITKRNLVIQKWFSFVFIAILFVISGFLFTYSLTVLCGYNVHVEFLFLAWILMLPVQIIVGTIGTFLGCYFMDKSRARLELAIFLVFSYIITMFHTVNPEIDAIKYLSIFSYYNGSKIILETDIMNIAWINPIILLLSSIIILIFTLWWIERSDLIPHYDQEKPIKKGKSRGIPRLFFFVSKLKNKYPSLVEQIQADRLILNIYISFVFFIAVFQPFAYPGDIEMAKLTSNFGSNFFYDISFQGRMIEPTLAGWMLMEGFAMSWFHIGVFVVFMGPRIITRDMKHETADLLMGNPLKRENLLKERIMALTLEISMIFGILGITSVISQIVIGEYSWLIHTIIMVLVALSVFWFLTMIGILVSVYIKKKRLATLGWTIGYLLLLAPFAISGISKSLEFLSYLSPFKYYDPVTILMYRTIDISTIVVLLGFICAGVISIKFSLRKINKIELINTFEEKKLHNS